MRSKIEINLDWHPHRTTISIDGKPLENVHSLDLHVDVDHVPTLTLERHVTGGIITGEAEVTTSIRSFLYWYPWARGVTP